MKNIIKALLVFSSLILITFCSDNSVSNSDEHTDAVGMRIVSSGQTIVSYIRDDSTHGEIEVDLDELSAAMFVELYDDEEDEWFTPDVDHFTLTAEITDTTIAQFWQHDGEEGSFEFHIIGKKINTTNIVFSVIHDGHADFVSREIEIEVE
ncbi:MAG: hypothetical protein D8M58_03340 [Calditrichaeota bacterium]|nr:MAG: hypothetical protein DWQ03_03735 [Calditrichota bacterium]MBL1204400.1 hypothetical protein [Calditrichota bacterium]NOG44229.1 hypothetical protein [Calditrichota bacterium]